MMVGDPDFCFGGECEKSGRRQAQPYAPRCDQNESTEPLWANVRNPSRVLMYWFDSIFPCENTIWNQWDTQRSRQNQWKPFGKDSRLLPKLWIWSKLEGQAAIAAMGLLLSAPICSYLHFDALIDVFVRNESLNNKKWQAKVARKRKWQCGSNDDRLLKALIAWISWFHSAISISRRNADADL